MRTRFLGTLLAVLAYVGMSMFSNSLPVLAASRQLVKEQHTLKGKSLRANKISRVVPNRVVKLAARSQIHKRRKNATAISSFPGLSQDYSLQKAAEPPDVNVSVGPNNLVEVVNTEEVNGTDETIDAEFVVYGRDGGQLSSIIKFANWFNYSGRIGDPRIIYDPWGGRFIMIAFAPDGDAVFISVSQQSDAFGYWCNYGFPTLSGYMPDFPTIGVDSNGIYFSLNLSSFLDKTAQVFQVQRTQMESCQAASGWTWHDNMNDPDCDGAYLACRAFTITPAVMYSTAPYEYLIDSRPNSFGLYHCKLTFWKLDGAAHVLYTPVTINVQGCYNNAPSAPQQGAKVKLDVGDSRIYQASYMNGLLDTALTSGDSNLLPQISVIQWFKIDTSNPDNPNLAQNGIISTPATWYFYPAIQQDNNGNTVVVYAASSASTYPSIRYRGITINGSLEEEKVLFQSPGYYDDMGNHSNDTTTRWGDIQSAQLDPINSAQIWIAGQNALIDSSNPTQPKHYWSTYIGEVRVNGSGGNLWVTGHDIDYHCAFESSQCNYLQVAVNFVKKGSALPILALDHGTEVATAMSNAFSSGAPTVITVDPRSAFATLPLVSSGGTPLYSAIIVASDTTCGGCDNNDGFGATPDSDAINNRASDIAQFFNAGGGILALAGADNFTVFYNFLPVPAVGTNTTSPYTFTALGLSLGLIEGSDDNCCVTHNSFLQPATGSPFQIAETDGTGLPETMIIQNGVAMSWARPTHSKQHGNPNVPHN